MRDVYDAAWRAAKAPGAFDALSFNERGELAEGGCSNVFVRLDGQRCTPPLSGGVLAASAWAAREQVITLEMLDEAEGLVVCNALRGPLRAVLD